MSLLWPGGTHLSSDRPGGQTLSLSAWRDLALDRIVLALTADQDQRRELTQILSVLNQDPGVIRYRQDVVEDLLSHPDLCRQLEQLMPTIDGLARFAHQVVKHMNSLHEIAWRLGELQGIVDCVQGLKRVFSEVGEDIHAEGLRNLQVEISRIQASDTFQHLAGELPELLGQLRTSASVTIGVNLDQFLRPVEATLLSVNEEKFTGSTMLGRLFGKSTAEMEGMAQLHTLPRREVDGPYAIPISPELGTAVEPMMVPLFADLAKVIEKTTRPIARQLKKYSDIHSRLFINLRQDLAFFLGAVRWIEQVRSAGLPLCRPEVAPIEERVCEVTDSYNMSLALHLTHQASAGNPGRPIILNDVHLGLEGRIFILTGPNQGGKTTYMQAVGILQVLAQAGLWVPGRQARISPVDQIFTHFPLEEKLERETGRFGEETQRLGQIFRQITRHSFVLLNESLSSTSAGESYYLAQDVVRILRRIGVRAIYSTHLHQLAYQVDELNSSTPGDSRILSLVASPVESPGAGEEDIQRSYRVEIRPPLGRSYAKEIAARYGISYEQLEKILAERGVIDPPRLSP